MDLQKKLIEMVSEDIDKYLPVYNALYEENFSFDKLNDIYEFYMNNLPEIPESVKVVERPSFFKHELSLEDDLYLGKIIHIHKVLVELGYPKKEFEAAYLKAKDMLILYNDSLPSKISKHYINRGVDWDDLIQEGMAKLMTAVDRYDYRRGYKFITYATYWVRQAMSDYVKTHGKVIRKPTHIITQQMEINKAKQILSKEKNGEPTLEDISLMTGYTVEQILNVQRVSQDAVYYHALNPENEEFNFENFISDDCVLEDLILDNSLKEAIVQAMESLDERERKIITLRYGLIDDKRMTLEEVGKIVNLTKERVRQIESKALRNLRHPSRSKFLKDYV